MRFYKIFSNLSALVVKNNITVNFVFILILIVFNTLSFAQQILPYKNPNLSIETRVQDLISRMTPEEKFWQLYMFPGDLGLDKQKFKNGIFGLQVSRNESRDAAGQIANPDSEVSALEMARKINFIQKYFVDETRLGIPMIAFEEALHGLVGNGATTFPQSIALASSWDTSMMREVANAIAHETYSRGIRQVLSPVVNIASDVRWGRTEETYGEDPFLSAAMGLAFVSAFERMNIVTTPKHFLANNGDGGRDSYPIEYSNQQLEETYLPPFSACFEKGGSRSLMTSYNSLNGSPCTANDWLLNDKLKQEMKFKGFVISDACAVGGANVLHYTAKDYPDAAAKAMNHGLDVIFQTEYDHYKLFIPPFLDGRISVKTINEALARVLRVKFQLGLFENPYADEKEVSRWNGNPDHKRLARVAAIKSMVLLKNEKNILPLKKSIKSLAAIGTDAVESRLGGYSGKGNGPINILDGLKNKLGTHCELTYSPGCGRESKEFVPVPSSALSTLQKGKTENGLFANYYNNVNLSGNPVLSRLDKNLNFRWTLYPPDTSVNFDFFSVRWVGKIKAPVSGTYKIGLDGNDGYRLYLDGNLLIDNWKNQSYSSKLVDFNFVKDQEYDLKVEFFESSGSVWLKLVWNVGVENKWQKQIADAVETAKKAEIAILIAGIEEGEGMDRAKLSLPGHQEEMIRELAKTGKPLVVVLVGGSAITMSNWVNSVDGILDIWYPGEEGGNALADVLFGEVSPGGRLPITFPSTEGQLPLVYKHKPTGRNDDYGDLSGQPLFPFGFGLSYTSFDYSDLQFDKPHFVMGDSCKVSFKVRNSGQFDGDEVVQLYIRDLLSTLAQPLKSLKGFQRIHLKAGETKELSFKITPDLLKILNDNMKWVEEPGDFRIMIGSSSKDIRLREIISVY
ncbi:MAG: glycoside hydrolase family 3 C-terminal domain-containing protein [Bacteroidota bacterium]